MSDKNHVKGRGGVLVVDDAPENRKILGTYLEREGFAVQVAGDGEAALNSIYTDAPEIVLLDISMPDMDGYEVCRQLKSQESYADIPVLFISALGKTEDKVKGFEVGGVDYITKPFQFEEVKARVNTHLKIYRLESEREKAIEELAQALTEVKELKGLLPICSSCHKIRDDDGYWNLMENYITDHTDASFSHSVCPGCVKKLYPELSSD